jgi:hypothetical protein
MRQAAIVFAVLSGLVFVFQLSVALGAPLGQLTQGGLGEGQLSGNGRLLVAGSALLTLAMAQIVLAHGEVVAGLGPLGSRGALWVVLVLLLAKLLMNFMSPSAPARLLWLPVLAVMLVCAGIVALRSTRA